MFITDEGITSENYVNEVLRTESYDLNPIKERINKDEIIRLLHSVMGLATETGELMDMLKKHIFYGKDFDRTNAIEEAGDVIWYIGIAVDVLKTTMNEIMTKNIEKLRLRYPEKFTSNKAINRDIDKERKVLENNKNFLYKVKSCKKCNYIFNYELMENSKLTGRIICPNCGIRNN